ncbi:MAG: bifunctional DNA-formamidopyrimidine glycosylase/DNA-(apurinic or apyrimidinic site) lyase [Humidesulfovibrio sp.]
MPELPEVETIARTLAGEVESRLILAVDVLDPSAVEPQAEAFRELVLGRRIAAVGRRGKLLLLHLQAPGGHDGGTIAVHLRMTGRVLALAPGEAPVRPRVILTLSDRGNGGLQLVFSDVRRFGRMHAFAPGGGPGSIDRWPFYRDLGPEPLLISAQDFRRCLAPCGKKSRARIKALLLDQTVMAGIGNIYADEALLRAGIRPDAAAGDLSARRLERLFAAIQAVLAQAIAENGSSIRDYRDAHGDAGAFQNHFRAYGRAGQPCLDCGTPLRSMRVAGRTSTFCPRCQTA